MAELDRIIGHSLTEALIRGEAQGLPRIPARWRMAVAEIAACCREQEFAYLTATESTFVDVEPLVEAGVWILDRIAPAVDEFRARQHRAQRADVTPVGEALVGEDRRLAAPGAEPVRGAVGA